MKLIFGIVALSGAFAEETERAKNPMNDLDKKFAFTDDLINDFKVEHPNIIRKNRNDQYAKAKMNAMRIWNK